MPNPWEEYAESGPWDEYAPVPTANEEAEAAAKKAGSAPSRFMSGLSESANPLNILSFLANAVSQPGQAITDAVHIIPNTAENIVSKIRSGDYAGAAGFTAGLVAPAATMGVANPAISKILNKSAEKSYFRAINPTKEKAKFTTENQVVPELLRRRESAWSLESLRKKASNKAEDALKIMDEEWASLPNNAIVDTAPIVSAMDDTIKQYQVPGMKLDVTTGQRVPTIVSISPEAVENLTRIRNTVDDLGDKVSPQTLRKVRQIWDREVSKAGGYAGKEISEGSKIFAREEAANAIRRELANQFPDIAKINAEYTFWARVQGVTGETIRRRVGQSVPLGEQLATAAGGAGGLSSGGAMGAAGGAAMFKLATKVFRSPGYKMVSAVQKTKLANAFASGNLEAIQRSLSVINAGLPKDNQ